MYLQCSNLDTSIGLMTFVNNSVRGWQIVWSGHKYKHEDDTALLLASHVNLEDHAEHLAARIHTPTTNINGLRLIMLNLYSLKHAASQKQQNCHSL